MVLYSPEITLIQNALIKIEDKMARDYLELEILQSSFKGAISFTNTLLSFVKERLLDSLSRNLDYGIIYEGAGERGKNNFLITIDGKDNLQHAIPYFAVVIAVEREGKIVAGIIDNPITREIYIVDDEKHYALVNTFKMRVSQRDKDFVVALTEQNLKYKNVIVAKSTLLNLCHVARGKYDATIVTDNNPLLELGYLFVKNSGGTVEDNVAHNGKFK
ncbi:MAG: hypothetical protein LBT02_04145 [Rickettsiales bacterium]|jgi:fructose-1,6-bisphosphatase/inositol monophosphatase family enzyme|nr:hypothetical protein [Rickettsiales bacterium]